MPGKVLGSEEAKGVLHLPVQLMCPEVFHSSSHCRVWEEMGCMSKEVGQIQLLALTVEKL